MPDRTLSDRTGRAAIRSRLDQTLFVEAGAGSGKTTSLVDRVIASALDEGIPLRRIAAVTFTDKAAAELRDRLRAVLVAAARDARAAGKKSRAAAADRALADLDFAAIGTLHSFARRILSEHPIEAGLPPLIEVLDEVASTVAFEERWIASRAALLEEPALRSTLLLALGAGVKLEDLRSIAVEFSDEWDRLDPSLMEPTPADDPRVEVDEIAAAARDLCAREAECADSEDKFLPSLQRLASWVDQLQTAPDDPTRLEVLGAAAALPMGHGKGASWHCDLKELKAELKRIKLQAAEERQRILDVVLPRLGNRIAAATLESARQRRHEGLLEFHDLLVLARDLLRSPDYGAQIRQRLQQRYQRLLLDEFQDTDPIQIELAVRIAGGAPADPADWRDVDVPDGRLFVVGDPKQSIYRFRRADISTYLNAQDRLGTPVRLTTNFRSGRPLVEWINAVFDRLIVATPGCQPAYQPLHADRCDAPGGNRVVTLGETPHEEGTADQIREREAADVVAAITAAVTEGWQVQDRDTKQWRPAGLGDIAVLVPARTSLPQLEDALDSAGIPYRAEASSLVYRTREVRDLLMTARAVDDPSDALALVSALRSPVFGCGDDDLWTWKRDGGRFNLLAPTPESVPDDHPVREAVGYLRTLHNERVWRAPSELLDRITRDRRMLELGAAGPRARDVWRRLRFVIDQARAWSEAEHGGLRAYLQWARRQGDESARVAEAVLPETDADAVRVMTIHAAKGLEFPVVVVSGLSSRAGGGRRGVQVLWPPSGGYQLKLNATVRTRDFDLAQPLDEQMDHHERLRLLYVACTRARDHLVVSLHRRTRRQPCEDPAMTNAELLYRAGKGAPHASTLSALTSTLPAVESPSVPPLPDWSEWSARRDLAVQAAARRSAVSASSLEGSARLVRLLAEPTDAGAGGLAKGPRDLDLPPWNKGRYGTAVGRAVHAVLQTVDLATGEGLAAAVAAQSLAEGVLQYEDVVLRLCQAALRSPTVQRAAARPLWRETYVGTTLPDGTVLEGFIDLVFRDDGLVVVDYKTDAVPREAIDSRVRAYRPQLAAYLSAIARATGERVSAGVLVFLHPDGCIDVPLEAAPLIERFSLAPLLD